MSVRAFIVSHVILKRGRVAQRAFQGRIYDSDMVAHRFRSGVLRFRSTLSHRRRALRYRPVLRTQRSLLLPRHRPERTLGLMGLRIHRSSSLPLSLAPLDPQAPATRAYLPPIDNGPRKPASDHVRISSEGNTGSRRETLKSSI